MGIGYSPTWLFEDEMKKGDLKVLLPDWPTPTLPINIVSPPQRRQSAKVKAFIFHMTERSSQQSV
jgi:DNA-binding transcriptional LysR family regulator